jgi:hypothetical protein
MSKKGMAWLLVVAVLLPIALAPSDAWAGGGYYGGYYAAYGLFAGLALGAALTAPYRYPYPYYPSYPAYSYGPSYYYAPPAVVYQQAPTAYAAPAPYVQREVVYANGKCAHGEGVPGLAVYGSLPGRSASAPPAR